MTKGHVVEIHFGPDVLSKDYGSETAARRACVRLLSVPNARVRYYSNGHLVFDSNNT